VLEPLKKHQMAQEILETIQFLHQLHQMVVVVAANQVQLGPQQDLAAVLAVEQVVMVVQFLAVAVLLIKVLLAVQVMAQTAQAVVVEQGQ
jgi:ribosome biogenesis protein Tsr3